MRQALLAVALVVMFFTGWAVSRTRSSGADDIEQLRDAVSRLRQQVRTLEARLHAREGLGPSRPSGATVQADTSSDFRVGRSTDRFVAGAIVEEPVWGDRPAGRGRNQPQAGGQGGASASRSSAPGAAVTGSSVEAALQRFYAYLETTNGIEGRGRWQKMRELVDELRAMGEPAAKALMQVLAAGTDTDERRAAARLLGTLQVGEALPILRDVVDKESDPLLRRAAASALRQLQTPDAVPLMERLVTTPGEDRFVRLSAAYGLAESGRPLGVTGLTQIFDEANADGRGREMAFRALASLQDERALPFMRQVVSSQAEPSYRLQAIRYLSAQGDRQALGILQTVMSASNEQPSIRDAAAQAYTAISTR
jgi:hypothetical protein